MWWKRPSDWENEWTRLMEENCEVGKTQVREINIPSDEL